MLAQVLPAVVGAVLGGVIGVFREDIRNLLDRKTRRRNEYLLDAWDCTWNTLEPKPEPQILDRVTITSVRGNVVKAVGTTPKFGVWDADGRAAYLAVSFSYSGREAQQNLIGAIALKKVQNNVMSGAWAQYSGSGDVVSGTTEWHRVPTSK